MQIAALGRTILIGQMSGDRPAVITKVFSNTAVEACGFMPLPEQLSLVKIHACRAEAIQAGQQGNGVHAYWPTKV